MFGGLELTALPRSAKRVFLAKLDAFRFVGSMLTACRVLSGRVSIVPRARLMHDEDFHQVATRYVVATCGLATGREILRGYVHFVWGNAYSEQRSFCLIWAVVITCRAFFVENSCRMEHYG
eukprot:TRINITY_DN32328_c0_g1_i1.p1 TRINITY_DN32328_c0_g1~~TRINITY_DN32328_c0_g1_i1.p1  ORF type:complete len:121 (+),score=13.81 TRINITY_DN32328_c0_g1_i1:448-810(+)